MGALFGDRLEMGITLFPAFDPTAEVIENLAGPNTEKHPYEEARHELFHETNKDEVYTDVFNFIHRTIRR